MAHNRITLVVDPKALPTPAALLHLHGIYELLFKGPPGTVLYVNGTRTGELRRCDGDEGGHRRPRRDTATRARGRRRLGNPDRAHRRHHQNTMFDVGGRHVITVAAYDDITGRLADFSLRGPLVTTATHPWAPWLPSPTSPGPG